MKIFINLPVALNEQGKRNNNEDSIYPLPSLATANDSLFLVCDGVGGADKGEVASQLACDSFVLYFKENVEGMSNEGNIKDALEFVQERFDVYLNSNPESSGMGTTMTLLHLHEKGATIVWCGDSRVYQFRNGAIINKTDDHSLVNELLKAGAMTPEEAEQSDQKNVITRAIQGNSVKKTKADVFLTADIKEGDSFFMCTDGVLESVSDDKLQDIIRRDIPEDQKMKFIDELCAKGSHDNYSAYLICVDSVEGAQDSIEVEEPIYISSEIEGPTTEKSVKESDPVENKTSTNNGTKPQKKGKSGLTIFLIIIIAILIMIIIYLVIPLNNSSDKEDAGPDVPKQEIQDSLESVKLQKSIQKEEDPEKFDHNLQEGLQLDSDKVVRDEKPDKRGTSTETIKSEEPDKIN